MSLEPPPDWEDPPPGGEDDYGQIAPSVKTTGDDRSPPEQGSGKTALKIINPVSLQGAYAPAREWIVDEWLPIGVVTANYGDGGTGKTLLAQQLMTATATGAPWCGREVLPCRSLGLFCEDDEGELHRRQAAINEALRCNFSDLSDMRWVSGVGYDCTLVNFDAGKFISTGALADIVDKAKDFGARLLVLDTAADLFGGNENDRHQVRQFISVLTGIAAKLDGAVLLNAHPSRSGIQTGNLDGGSTAWNNSVRSRWSLARPAAEEGNEADADARVLTRRKANYARIGEDIRLRWERGALLPANATSTGSPIEQAACEIVFLELLASRYGQGMWVSHSKNAGNYAPKEFAKAADRKGYGRKEFEEAMSRLFAEKRIRAEEYGKAANPRQRLTISKPAAETEESP